MPPRYVYWTILIDNAPTAFRAVDRADLLPTLHQLQRKNSNVVLKWFARGRLWESPEAERAAQAAPRSTERRDRDWRPGGEHKDPRARFDKEAQKRRKREARAAGAPVPRDRDRPYAPPPPTGARPPWKPSSKKPWSPKPGAQRPWRGKPDGQKPWANKPAGARPWTAKPAGQRPWTPKPPGGPPRGGRPWRNDPRGTRPEGARNAGGEGRTPWSGKPPAASRSDRRWRDRPGEHDPRKRRDESPDVPPPPEKIATKPKPPERG